MADPPTKDHAQEAFERALGALGHRERTVAEITGWLRDRGYAHDVVDQAVGRLLETGGLDDERFAIRYAEDKRELRGWGPDRISMALMERGVSHDLIEAALAGESHADEVSRAAQLLAERGGELSDEAGRGRALAFLARRGYDVDAAYDAVRRAEGEQRAA
jgi:regulatory protein